MIGEIVREYDETVIALARAGKVARVTDLMEALKLSYKTFRNHRRRYALAYHGEDLKTRLENLWLNNLESPEGICILSFLAPANPIAPQVGIRLDPVKRPTKPRSEQARVTSHTLASLGK